MGVVVLSCLIARGLISRRQSPALCVAQQAFQWRRGWQGALRTVPRRPPPGAQLHLFFFALFAWLLGLLVAGAGSRAARVRRLPELWGRTAQGKAGQGRAEAGQGRARAIATEWGQLCVLVGLAFGLLSNLQRVAACSTAPGRLAGLSLIKRLDVGVWGGGGGDLDGVQDGGRRDRWVFSDVRCRCGWPFLGGLGGEAVDCLWVGCALWTSRQVWLSLRCCRQAVDWPLGSSMFVRPSD